MNYELDVTPASWTVGDMSKLKDLPTLLSAGACLVDSGKSTSTANLGHLLAGRLIQYEAQMRKLDSSYSASVVETASLGELQEKTALQALYLVERIHSILCTASLDDLTVGTRDLVQIRTLLSISFRWAVDPVLLRILSNLPAKASETQGTNVWDSISSDFLNLCSIFRSVIRLLFPSTGATAQLSQTHVTAAMLDYHAIDALRPCIVLGWLPQSMTQNSPPSADMRAFVIQFLST